MYINYEHKKTLIQPLGFWKKGYIYIHIYIYIYIYIYFVISALLQYIIIQYLDLLYYAGAAVYNTLGAGGYLFIYIFINGIYLFILLKK